MILLVYLACSALHIIDAVRIREKGLRCSNVYLTININAFLKINTQKYIFLNLHILLKERLVGNNNKVKLCHFS